MRESVVGRLGCAAVAALAAAATPVSACTTVLLQRSDQMALAKSYDYDMGQGLIIVNPRGLAKHSMRTDSSGPRLTWVSRYGSVTFNQYGRELPAGGMNEAGLMIEVMWLDETRYPEADGRPALPDLQWIQYQLDRWATVEEVVAHAGEVSVTSASARVHFLVCDRGARCAAVEFLDGEMVITEGDAMPVPTLTNSNYADSQAFLLQHEGFGGARPVPEGPGSLDRFVRASAMAASAAGSDTGAPGLVDDAFAILDSVSAGPRSVWNIVYDPVAGVIHYRTFAQPRIKRLRLSGLGFECSRPVRALDVDAERWGDVTSSLLELDDGTHWRLVERSFTGHVVPAPRGAILYVHRFARSFPCTAEQP